ncbi:Carrot EP3-3 chitinase [Hibiscus syriacus]|uniref:Carrot EP3-3 chitinase n=1 Tax=Hibiscus syriacus TaxID=106335 RepID=A0A6A3A155_HIBSY|nr:Carrot EP3-3 chitinase [Hibiscus syriacus]
MLKCLLTIFVVGSVTITTIADNVIDEFLCEIFNQIDPSCEGKNFYTMDAFLQALSSFPQFGSACGIDILPFFAHVIRKTEHLCYIEEIGGPSFPNNQYCDPINYPCNPDKSYYGRGPLQLTWNYNYIPVRESIGFDGINSPKTVVMDPLLSRSRRPYGIG